MEHSTNGSESANSNPWRRRIITAAGIVFAVAIFVFVLPRIVDYGEVWQALLNLSWLGVAALVVVTVLNVATYGPPLMAAMPGLRYWPSQAAALTSTASTYLAPGGAAVGVAVSYGMLRAWGFPRRRITLALSLFTLWNQCIIFGLPLVAIGILSFSGKRDPVLAGAARVGFLILVVVVALLALSLRSGGAAERAGDLAAAIVSRPLRIFRRNAVTWSGTSFRQFRAEALELARTRWHWLTVAALVGHLTVYFVLIVALRAVGVSNDEVSISESFAAWTLARLLGSIPIAPGGLGVVDVGVTAALIGFGGSRGEVVTAVLIYRLLTIVPPVAYGAIAGSLWRRAHPGQMDDTNTPDAH